MDKTMNSAQSFNEQMERDAQDGSEWTYGAVTQDLAAIPVEKRLQYLPRGVYQFNNVMDTNGCASRSPLNIIETKLDWFYDNGMHPAIKRWCDEKGYRVDGKFALADAFIEILSGTTRQGNSLKAPVDAIYRYGVIPARYLPLEDNMTWEEYMDPQRITNEMKNLGSEFLRRIMFNYEKTNRFLEALDEDLLDLAGRAWPQPVNGVYPRTNDPPNHAFAGITSDIDIFDTYDPFVKRLAKDYKFFDWGYSISITNQNPYPNETITVFEVLKEHGLLQFFAEFLKRLGKKMGVWSQR